MVFGNFLVTGRITIPPKVIMCQLLLVAAKGNQGLRFPLALPVLENTSSSTILRNTYKAYERQAGDWLFVMGTACVKWGCCAEYKSALRASQAMLNYHRQVIDANNLVLIESVSSGVTFPCMRVPPSLVVINDKKQSRSKETRLKAVSFYQFILTFIGENQLLLNLP